MAARVRIPLGVLDTKPLVSSGTAAIPGVSAFPESAARAGRSRLVPASTAQYHRDLCPFVPRLCPPVPGGSAPSGEQHAGRGDPGGDLSEALSMTQPARTSLAVGALGTASSWLSCPTPWSGSGATTSRWTSCSSTHIPSDLPRDLRFAVWVGDPVAGPPARSPVRGPGVARCDRGDRRQVRAGGRALADRPIGDDRRLHRDAFAGSS